MTDTKETGNTNEERMVIAHQLGMRDYRAGLGPVHHDTLGTDDERTSYLAGYRGARDGNVA
jgi:hypothetical protein